MSLLSALSTSVASLGALSSQMQVTSDNIANAGTEGYTAKKAVVKTVVYSDGATSVTIDGYERAEDESTMLAWRDAATENGSLSTTDDYLTRVQHILGSSNTTTSTSLAELMTNFTNAWTSLEAEPESVTSKQNVISAGDALADGIQAVASDLLELKTSIKSDIETDLTTLNSSLSKIKEYNDLIASARSNNQSSGDLEDARDRLILDVAGLVDVTIMARDNGTIAIYTAGGYQLMDTDAQQFSYDGNDIVNTNNTSLSLNNTLGGGSLEAELDFIDDSASSLSSTDEAVGVIGKCTEMIDTLAAALVDTSAGTFSTAYGGTFFTATSGSEASSISVDSSLLDGSTTLDTTTVEDVVGALSDSTRTFTSSAFSVSDTTYVGWTESVLSYFQQATNTVSVLADAAEEQVSYLETEYANKTGVSTDEELVKLVTLQNSYSASAKVMSVVNDMLKAVMNVV